MKTDRREFLKGVAMSAGAGVIAGCACEKGPAPGRALPRCGISARRR